MTTASADGSPCQYHVSWEGPPQNQGQYWGQHVKYATKKINSFSFLNLASGFGAYDFSSHVFPQKKQVKTMTGQPSHPQLQHHDNRTMPMFTSSVESSGV
jgi:hypothetical protein